VVTMRRGLAMGWVVVVVDMVISSRSWPAMTGHVEGVTIERTIVQADGTAPLRGLSPAR